MAKRKPAENPPHFIVNPAASAGKTGKFQATLMRVLQERFPDGFILDVTSNPGHATLMTREAIKRGATTIVAVGGDGTINEVINGFFDHRGAVNAKARLGFVCIGTGKDVARNLNLPATLSDQLNVIQGDLRRPIDLGRVSYHTSSGKIETRHFINDCQMGIAARVVERVTPPLKKLGGFLAFGLASTLTALNYRARLMTVRLDGQPWISERLLGVVAANGRFAGGGMDFAPSSRIDDATLDVIALKDQPVLSRLKNLPKIYDGSYLEYSWVEHRTARRISVESPERVGVEVDGELIGFLPCEISVHPRALLTASPF